MNNANAPLATLVVPALDHDAIMLARFGKKVSPQGRLERRIVAALIAHMGERGWRVESVFDGDTTEKAHDAKSAMEFIFNLDESRLTFTNGKTRHAVLLICGNAVDIISDWGYHVGDRDGFDAAMEAFDAEVYS